MKATSKTSTRRAGPRTSSPKAAEPPDRPDWLLDDRDINKAIALAEAMMWLADDSADGHGIYALADGLLDALHGIEASHHAALKRARKRPGVSRRG